MSWEVVPGILAWGLVAWLVIESIRIDAKRNGKSKPKKITIEKAVRWLLENGFVDMGAHDTDIHFKSGYIHDFIKAMEDE